jgi:hypothetical protein
LCTGHQRQVSTTLRMRYSVDSAHQEDSGAATSACRAQDPTLAHHEPVGCASMLQAATASALSMLRTVPSNRAKERPTRNEARSRPRSLMASTRACSAFANHKAHSRRFATGRLRNIAPRFVTAGMSCNRGLSSSSSAGSGALNAASHLTSQCRSDAALEALRGRHCTSTHI